MHAAKLLSYTIFIEKLICGFIQKIGKRVSSYTDSIQRVVSMKLLVSMPNVAQPQIREAAFNARSLDPLGPARLFPSSQLSLVKKCCTEHFKHFTRSLYLKWYNTV
jgi:hypothetical protein